MQVPINPNSGTDHVSATAESVEQNAKPVTERLGSQPLVNLKREAFCQALAKGMDKPDAYWAAGYKAKDRFVANVAANTLFRDVWVFNRIQYLLGRKADATAEECGITRAWVMEMLKENAEGALGRVELDPESGDVHAVEPKDRAAANTALKMLGQEAGQMFRDRSEMSGPNGGPIEMRARVTVNVYLPDNRRDRPKTEEPGADSGP